jgi:hypothetical protein
MIIISISTPTILDTILNLTSNNKQPVRAVLDLHEGSLSVQLKDDHSLIMAYSDQIRCRMRGDYLESNLWVMGNLCAARSAKKLNAI